MSELTRLPFTEVYKLPVIEFLNYACYDRDKKNWIKESQKRYAKKN